MSHQINPNPPPAGPPPSVRTRPTPKTAPSLWACDMALLLDVLAVGAATFEPATNELVFNGLRYGCKRRDWTEIVNVIGRRNLHIAAGRGGAA
jgi:hypothetical protein